MNCEYPTYRAGKRQDCGKPATHRGEKRPKLFYCAEHNSLVANRGGIATKPVKEGKR